MVCFPTYFGLIRPSGDQLSLADLAVSPFLNAWEFSRGRLRQLDPVAGDFEPSVLWPNLMAYRKLMNDQHFVAVNSYRDEDYAKFVVAYVSKDASAVF